ncbi:DUF305 domain-containing protein [Mycobacterium sp. E796]|uniref:DUF305 domain-containing protein n=1 Tax=Mycobacterium sp. E796 TaxID=1834151 RepID=UPI0018D2B042|nr:DUF305 domain-containing protein [Mycobacterium sp. E796]
MSVTLTACSCSGSVAATHVGSSAGEAPVSNAQPATHTAADDAFVSAVTAQHRQGMKLSSLVPQRSTSPAITSFAGNSAAAMQSELTVAQALLVQWTQNTDSSTAGSVDRPEAQGVADAATMDRLAGSRGSAFDQLWLDIALALHAGALDTAVRETAAGQNADAITLARQLVPAEKTAIAQLNQIRDAASDG